MSEKPDTTPDLDDLRGHVFVINDVVCEVVEGDPMADVAVLIKQPLVMQIRSARQGISWQVWPGPVWQRLVEVRVATAYAPDPNVAMNYHQACKQIRAQLGVDKIVLAQ